MERLQFLDLFTEDQLLVLVHPSQQKFLCPRNMVDRDAEIGEKETALLA